MCYLKEIDTIEPSFEYQIILPSLRFIVFNSNSNKSFNHDLMIKITAVSFQLTNVLKTASLVTIRHFKFNSIEFLCESVFSVKSSNIPERQRGIKWARRVCQIND